MRIYVRCAVRVGAAIREEPNDQQIVPNSILFGAIKCSNDTADDPWIHDLRVLSESKTENNKQIQNDH